MSLFGLGASSGWIKCSQVPEMMQNGFPASGPLLVHASLAQMEGFHPSSERPVSSRSCLKVEKSVIKACKRVNVCWNTHCPEAHGKTTVLTSQSPALTSSLGHKSLSTLICLFSFASLSHFYSGCTDTNPFVFHVLTSGVLFKAFRRCFLSVVFPGDSWDDAVPAPRAAEGLAASLLCRRSFPSTLITSISDQWL